MPGASNGHGHLCRGQRCECLQTPSPPAEALAFDAVYLDAAPHDSSEEPRFRRQPCMRLLKQAGPGQWNEEAAAMEPAKHEAEVLGTARSVPATSAAASSDDSQAKALHTGRAASCEWQYAAAVQGLAVQKAGDLSKKESAFAAAAAAAGDAKAPAKGQAVLEDGMSKQQPRRRLCMRHMY
ncbi:hypothetical protein WJX74_004748 [Apatococcus lobatus]|uniref:Uncharacterized protein n=1 Tax=Apatococcus lobatus TaxID=904363 RepID=A0AAW1RWL5_9CHLO